MNSQRKYIMTRQILSVVLLIIIVASCKNNSSPDPDFNYDKISKNKSDSVTGQTQDLIPGNKNPSTLLPAPALQNTTTASSGLNPEHGKPGHRCDIAVGAPLNSTTTTNPVQTAPQKTITTNTTPQSITTTPAITTQTNSTNKTTTAPGMNPPHGQPGHRCDIGVGAPLNSKPSTTQPQKITTQTVSPTNTVTAPGMNPPHGQPGHRCDIPVGTALSQPVKNSTDAAKNTTIPVKDSTKK